MKYLFVDKITQLDSGKTTKGIKTITKDEFYTIVSSKWEDKTIFLPSLIGEALGQLTALNVMQAVNFTKRPVAGVVSKATVKRPVFVGETLVMQSQIDHMDNDLVEYHGSVHVNDEEIFTLKSALGPLLPMDDFVEPEKAKAQFNLLMDNGYEINDQENFSSTILNLNYDKQIEFNAGKNFIVEKYIAKNDPFFQEHFPNKPVLPMTMLLEFMRFAGELFLQKSGFTGNFYMSEFKKAKMSDFITPNNMITLSLQLRSIDEDSALLNFSTFVQDKRVCFAQGVFKQKEVS